MVMLICLIIAENAVIGKKYLLIFILNFCRVSSREAMLNHFTEFHYGTSLLLCPFCMYTYIIPQVDRQRNVFVAKTYVLHMMDHDLGLILIY